jgi:hypothetical protein
MKHKVISSLLISLILILVYGCNTNSVPSVPTHQQDLPRYTADQVIYTASASPYDDCGYVKNKTKWTVIYQGDGRWLVTKHCLSQYGQELYTEQFYFYENTGKIVKY